MSAAVSHETSFELTWGLELELVVRYDRQRYSQYLVSGEGTFWKANASLDLNAKFNHLVRTDVIQALKLEQVPVHGILDDLSGPERFSKWTVWLDGSIVPNAQRLPSKWAGSSYTGVEIKTPVFYYQEKAFHQLIHVVRVLNDNFSIFMNNTCGLHVHVGNGMKGIPFSTVKNLAILATIFERQFNSLHPIHRVRNKYCRPLAQRWHGLDPILIASEIEAFKNIDQLVKKLSEVHGNPEKHHTINFRNLVCKDGTQTIEFRQHKGTTDPVAMIQWARLCCELVSYCYHAGEFGVLDFLCDRVSRKQYSVLDLLTDLGLGGPSSLADYYEQDGLYEHPRENWHYQELLEPLSPQISQLTATPQAIPAKSNSSKASKDPFLMLIKTLAYEPGKLLVSSPKPDLYETLNQIFAGWHKGKMSYDDLRDELNKVYEDAGASFEVLDACLERTNG
ncbi:MAG: hypothetical protein Q9198_000597 [Flavoplaca austrocitrina]